MWNDLQAALFLTYKYITRGNKGTVILTVLVATLAFIQINLISGIFSGAVGLIYEQTKDNYVGNIVIQAGQGPVGQQRGVYQAGWPAETQDQCHTGHYRLQLTLRRRLPSLNMTLIKRARTSGR